MKKVLHILLLVILMFSGFLTARTQSSKLTKGVRIGYNIDKSTPFINEEAVFNDKINYLCVTEPIRVNNVPGKNGGTGTPDDPFIVSSATDLFEIAERVNSGTEATGIIFPNGNQGYAGQYFLMENDLDLSAYNPWPGISIPGQALFYGNFDGNFHSIHNLITNPSAGTNQGLFTVIGVGGSVKNLIIASGNIRGTYYVGAICGALAEGASIDNCHNYCDVTITNYYAGGIAGAGWGSIRNCTNSGTHSSTDFVGGIVGDFYGNLENCSNIGDIYGNTSVGGIIGYSANAETKLCVNSGNSYGTSGYVGGVIGFLTNYDSDNSTGECLNFGNVESPSGNSGAVIGRLWHSDTQSTAYDCYYNKQMCSKLGVAPGGDIPGVAEGRFTYEMLDDQLDLSYSWKFETNKFPRPYSIKDHPISILAASPAFFYFINENEYDIYNSITNNFTVSIEDGVAWYSAGSDIVSILGRNINILNVGSDTLMSYLGSALKRIVITVVDVPSMPFVCGSSTVTDLDGNMYSTVKIGDQCWISGALKTTKYSDGSEIPNVPDPDDWKDMTIGAYVWYDNDNTWKDGYGALYNWFAVNDEKGICPSGWHVPDRDDIDDLIFYLDSQGYPNDKDHPLGASNTMKSCRQVNSPHGGDCNTSDHPRWNSQGHHNGFDVYGFEAYPVGRRGPSGGFASFGTIGHFWFSEQSSATNAWYYAFSNSSGAISNTSSYGKAGGFGVHCVRDFGRPRPQGLNGIIENQNVKLTWMAPDFRVFKDYNLIGYYIYCNNIQIGETDAITLSFIDYSPMAGMYEYSVTAVYGEPDAGESDAVSTHITLLEEVISINPQYLEFPVPVGGSDSRMFTLVNESDAELSWTADIQYSSRAFMEPVPVPIGAESTEPLPDLSIAVPMYGGAPVQSKNRDEITLHYDGDNYTAIGTTGGSTFHAAARFPSDKIIEYIGYTIESVSVYIHDQPNTTTLRIRGAGTTTSPGDILHQQAFTTTPNSWVSVPLTDPVLITGEDIWVSYMVNHEAGEHPAGCDAGPAQPDGDWMSTTGTSWNHLVNSGMDYNWNIRALIKGGDEYNWLSLDNYSGTIAPDGSQSIVATVNANELIEDSYQANIQINSINPLHAPAILPVVMEVGGDSTIVVYPKPRNLQGSVNDQDVTLAWQEPYLNDQAEYEYNTTRSFEQLIPEPASIVKYSVLEQFDESIDIAPTGGKPVIVPAGVKHCNSNKNLLFDNGPFINSPGTGPGGTDQSVLQSTSLGMNSLGFNVSATSDYLMADDFVVNAFWEIESITFYTYQTGSGTSSTITEAYVLIYDGSPMDGAQIIWGNLTDNIMSATEWINCYRVSETTVNTDRPIMSVTCATSGLNLSPGTYWIAFALTGTEASGPWAHPVTINGEHTTGNALHKVSTGWKELVDSGTETPQGIPFIMEGSFSGSSVHGELLGYNIYRDNTKIGETIADVRTYTDSDVAPGSYVYGVTAVYGEPYPGESDPIHINITIIGPSSIPFEETWASGNFNENGWTFEPAQGNWSINASTGNPAPSAQFGWSPSTTNYSFSLISNNIIATQAQENLTLEFDINLNDYANNGNEKMKVHIWDGNEWVLIETFSNTGDIPWTTMSYDITSQALSQITKVKFEATGLNTYDVNYWYIDNIKVFEGEEVLYPAITVNPNALQFDVPVGGQQSEILIIGNTGEAPLVWSANVQYLTKSFTKPEAVPIGVEPIIGNIDLSHELGISGGSPDTPALRETVILHYDGENAGNAIGLTSGGTFYVAARFPTDLINIYAGYTIESVDVYISSVPSNIELIIWDASTTTSPGPVLHQQAFTSPGSSWTTITLTNPLMLSGQDIWVGYTVTHAEGDHPAGCDAGPADPNGDWISTDGTAWQHLADLNLNYNWNIRVLIESGSDFNWLSLSSASGTINPDSNQQITALADAGELDVGTYNANILISSNDPLTPVTTVPVQLEVLVGIEEVLFDQIKVYPIPVISLLNIELIEDITQIRLINIIGEIVKTKSVNGESHSTLDLTDLPQGMYSLQFISRSGEVHSQKIILAK